MKQSITIFGVILYVKYALGAYLYAYMVLERVAFRGKYAPGAYLIDAYNFRNMFGLQY